MQPIESAYLAGLLDGEGAFVLTKVVNPSAKRGWSWRPGLQVSNNSLKMIAWVRDRTDVATVRSTGSRSKASHFRWQLQAPERILEVLEHVRPLLVAKTEHADLLIEACRLLMKLPGRGWGEQYLQEISPRLMEIRDRLRTINPKAWRSRGWSTRFDSY